MPKEKEAVQEKEDRKAKREKKKKRKDTDLLTDEMDQEEEKETSKVLIFFVSLLIVLIWLGIIGVLIKCDVGGFGSSVLYPMWKDVPYLNRILPDVEKELYSTEDTQYAYGSLAEAVERIKELERQVDALSAQSVTDSDTITQLEEQQKELQAYREREAEFEKEKEKFYEEVVFSDKAPDIEQYKIFYESIEKDNAEILYKQVIQQLQKDAEIEDYVKAYSSMKAKDAAEIFNTMTDDLELVAKILQGMNASARGNILAEMNADTAAKVTEILNPSR
ncbi:MAG: hypothetical protein MR356_02350 [Agathobacter sp.]|nr:hypothetical protein [Agathobacter sp.]MDY3888817.1 hypothetical protein [Agathobacter sp.]